MNDHQLEVGRAVGQAIDAGLSVIWPNEDGSKRPEGSWKDAQEKPRSKDELRCSFRERARSGLMVVCGEASGNLEVLDFEAAEIYATFQAAMSLAGEEELLERIESGYQERCPRGGYHLPYHCEVVAGNRKLAFDENLEVLIETRGEGGCFMAAPTRFDSSAWTLMKGGFATIATVTAEERETLHRIARLQCRAPKQNEIPVYEPKNSPSSGDRPGDDFNRRGSWGFLEEAGWVLVGQIGEQQYWRRPDKPPPGHSAVLHLDSQLFVPFSSNAKKFPQTEVGYSRFRTYAFVVHSGDFSAASRALRRQDYGRERAEKAALAETSRLLHLVAATTITVDRPRWVWDLRIPVGGTTLIPGREGLGKTAFVGHLAARLTRGELPGEWTGRPGAVIYIGYEDDRATVLVPRLVAAGADLSRFFFVDIPNGGTFLLDVDIDRLYEAVVATDLKVALVIVDPLDSHLGGGVDTHRKSEVQAAIQRLAEFAQQLRCGAAGLAHLNKSDTRDLLTRVVGSVGFTTSVRAVLGIGEHPNDQNDRVCVLGKANMCDRTGVPAIRFRVESASVPHPLGGLPVNTAKVVILGEETGIDPNSVITGNAAERQALEEAADWLQSMLSDGPIAAAEIRKMGAAEGFALATLKRARRRIGAVSERDDAARGRPAQWSLITAQAPLSHNPLEPYSVVPLTSTNGSEGGITAQDSKLEP